MLLYVYSKLATKKQGVLIITKLEQSQQKLNRLKSNLETSIQATYSHARQANGQPMNDKRNAGAFFNKRDQLENKIFNNLHAIKEQEERIEKMEDKEYKKENHLTANYGLETSVYNIDKLKKRKQDKATRDKVKLLESIAEKAKIDTEIMTEKTKSLIEDGTVKQWDKKPIYYFVSCLRKVALVIDNKTGEFIAFKKYAPQTDKDIETVKTILN